MPSESFEPSYTFHGFQKSISSITFSPNSQFLAITNSTSVDLFSTLDNRFIHHFDSHKEGINCLAFHPSSTQFITGSDDKTLKIYSTRSVLKTLRGHTNFVLFVEYHPNGNMIVSGGSDEAIRIWQVSSGFSCLIIGNTIRIIQAHSDPISSVRFTLDGTLIISSSFDGLVRMWDTATGQCMRTLADDERAPVTGVRLSKNNEYILTAGIGCNNLGLDETLKIWEFKSGMIIKTFKGHSNTKYCTGFGFVKLGNKTGVYVGSEDGTVVIYDLQTREIMKKIKVFFILIKVEDSPVVGIDVKDGLMATGGLGVDPVVKLWRLDDLFNSDDTN